MGIDPRIGEIGREAGKWRQEINQLFFFLARVLPGADVR